jgi:hypothetical protein
VGGETARLGLSRGELRWTGDGQGVFTGIDGVIGDDGGVWDMGGSETARLQGSWGELGSWKAFWGRSGASRCVLRRF